jgi:hypothetical protein
METSKSQSVPLVEAAPWLRDPVRRHAMILEAVERNSVIEGLPPFSAAIRERIAQQLKALASDLPPARPE